MADKMQLSIKSIQQDLKDGLDREQIGQKYGLNKTEVKKIFMHEKLKGLKTIKPKEEKFVLIDDADARPTPQVRKKKEEATGTDNQEAATGTTAQATTQSTTPEVNVQAAPVQEQPAQSTPTPPQNEGTTSQKGVW